MKSGLTLFAGVLIVLVGLAFVFPAVAQLRDTGALPALSVAMLFLGVTLTLAGVGAAYYGARRLRA
jgi:hypothetical protein